MAMTSREIVDGYDQERERQSMVMANERESRCS